MMTQYVKLGGTFYSQKATMCLCRLTGATQSPRRRVGAPESPGGEQTRNGCERRGMKDWLVEGVSGLMQRM